MRRRLRLSMAMDRPALQVQIEKAAQSLSKAAPRETLDAALKAMEGRLESSIRRRIDRKTRRPGIRYPQDLPIVAYREEMLKAIEKHPVVIVSGETGSGKTTQIPKFCLEAGRGISGIIGCTQPRRIAALTVSRRIAEEMGEPLGRSVGFKIRFQEKTGKDLFIKIMTDGILLAETTRDRRLLAYDTLIIDEAHERSLNIDFLLGYLRTLLQKRSDLKVIITSATLDTEKFSSAFGGAPVVEVSGRLYPVEVRYAVQEKDTGPKEDLPYTEMAAEAVKTLVRQGADGDILVFMPTERDIRETCELLEGMRLKKAVVMPLFARLPARTQQKVFAGASGRKIIVATNVAETSLTIPGIRYVVDTGLARLSRYSPSSRTRSLPILPVSQSSADQRKGRCGRMEDGVCIRLFSEADYQGRELYTPPEILRSNLAEVILKMIALDMGDPSEFPFIDKPSPKWIAGGYEVLTELGAIRRKPSGKTVLTETGRKMAQMPLDPRLSRMLLEAEKQQCLPEAAVLAAALSIPDPRETPMDREQEAREAHRTWSDPHSDFISLIALWQRFQEQVGPTGGASKMKRFCRQHFLSFRRMRDWQDIHTQIQELLSKTGLLAAEQNLIRIPDDPYSSDRGTYDRIHRSILSGFLSNIALQKEKNIYTAARGKEVMLFPGSGLFHRGGEWIVAAEIVETSRVFARSAALIESAWLEPIGRAQCRYTYGEPFWSKSKETVLALEKVHLYGLLIHPGRAVPFGPMDPDQAGAVFIREALMTGNVKHAWTFLAHNQDLMRKAEDLEHRLRRRDLKASETEIFEFYAKRLKGVFDSASLKKRILEKGSDAFLHMRLPDLLYHTPSPETLSRFPDTLLIGERSFPLSYRFNPGEEEDGVTVHIPLSHAPSLSKERLELLVPGLLDEKIEFLIRNLPRPCRKTLPPLPSFLDPLARELSASDAPLTRALSRFAGRRLGVSIPESAWPMKLLPDHLRMRVRLESPDGKCIRAGRVPEIFDFGPELREALAPPPDVKAAKKNWEKEGITDWTFGDLPETVVFKGRDRSEWHFFPALEKNSRGGGARLRLFSFLDEARAAHPGGVAALFQIRFSKPLNQLRRHIRLSKKPGKAADRLGGINPISDQVLQRVSADLFHKSVRSRKAFEALCEAISPTIHSRGLEVFERVAAVVEALDAAREKVHALEAVYPANAGILAFLESLRKDLEALVPKPFVMLYGDERLVHLPRYIRALAIRAERGVLDLGRDRERLNPVALFTGQLKELIGTLTPSVSDEKRKAVEELFWLIEEYKVTLFAQELKTPFPVSAKKIRAHIEAIEKMS